MIKTSLSRTLAMTAFAAILGTSLAKPSLAQTPNLSLSSSTSGSTVTVFLTLTNSASDGNNLFGFDTNIYIDSRYVSFAGTTPYTETFSGFSTSNGQTFKSYSSHPAPMTALEVEQDVGNGTPLTNQGVQQLGFFTLNIISPIPVGGTVVSLGSTTIGSDTAPTGGSDLVSKNGNVFSNVLASTTNTTIPPNASAAPEPSGAVVLLLGVAGVVLVAARRPRHGKS